MRNMTKLCECGCKTPTLPAQRTSRMYGNVKGQPQRFIKGHQLRLVRKTHPRFTRTPEERFMAYVDKNGPVHPHKPELGKCWLWTAALDKKGYGVFGVTPTNTVFAHRFSYEMKHGPLGDLFALHSCDNPACVNDAHLFAGTQAENMADMDAKQRRGVNLEPARAARRKKFRGTLQSPAMQ